MFKIKKVLSYKAHLKLKNIKNYKVKKLSAHTSPRDKIQRTSPTTAYDSHYNLRFLYFFGMRYGTLLLTRLRT